MAKRYTDEFRRDVVRIAASSGLTRPQLSSDLGIGLATLNKWVQQHQHDDLMIGTETPLVRETMAMLSCRRGKREHPPSQRTMAAVRGKGSAKQKRQSSLQAKAGEVRLYRFLKRRMAS